MQGLSLNDLKKHPSLIPLYTCFIIGAVGSAWYVFRLATRNPDVTWSQKKNPEPWQEYSDKQYKFYASENRPAIQSPAPKY